MSHDCDVDDRDGDYAMIVDAVFEAFNPPGDDVAEEAIALRAVEAARDFIASLPCVCVYEPDAASCRRCSVLGRVGDVPRGV